MLVRKRVAKFVAATRPTSFGQSRIFVETNSFDTMENCRFTLALSVAFGLPPPRYCSTFHGNFPSLLSAHSRMANPICLWLLAHVIRSALAFDRLRAGNNIPARIAMMAMTTSNSINVNAQGVERTDFIAVCDVMRNRSQGAREADMRKNF